VRNFFFEKKRIEIFYLLIKKKRNKKDFGDDWKETRDFFEEKDEEEYEKCFKKYEKEMFLFVCFFFIKKL